MVRLAATPLIRGLMMDGRLDFACYALVRSVPAVIAYLKDALWREELAHVGLVLVHRHLVPSPAVESAPGFLLR